MLQEGIDEYIASLSAREQGQGETNTNTIVAYRNDLNQASTYLTGLSIHDWQHVSQEHIACYMEEMREGQAYRPTTIARKLASLKTFFRYLLATGKIEADPLEGTSAPRVQKEPPQVLSQEQVASLFQQVPVNAPVGVRDMAMLRLLYATGMRVSELVALNLDDLDLEQGLVVCPGRNGKNRRERVLPISSLAIEPLQTYLADARPRLIQHHPDEQSLFVNHHGERLTRQGFWLIIKGYARLVGIQTITPHMLRHSFAILMLQNGMELRSVQELLGHAHLATTQVYSQLAREGVSSRV
jgi:integrase/recombinase XerD